MDKIFIEIHNRFPFLEKGDINILLSISELRKIQMGEVLVNKGEINKNVHIVLSGLLRSYAITSAGKERTVFIYKENMRAASIESVFYNRPSVLTIEAIEPSIVLIINSVKFQKIAFNNKNLLLILKVGMIDYLSETTERLYSFSVLSPEERYIRFCELYPDLIQRVPQIYLASYLGVTKVSLSRIKTRIAKRRSR